MKVKRDLSKKEKLYKHRLLDHGSCVLISTCILTNVSYTKVYKTFIEWGRIPNSGVPVEIFFKDNPVLFGYEFVKMDIQPMTLYKFCKVYNQDKYMICTVDHAIAVINGTVHDEESQRSKIIEAYKLINTDEQKSIKRNKRFVIINSNLKLEEFLRKEKTYHEKILFKFDYNTLPNIFAKFVFFLVFKNKKYELTKVWDYMKKFQFPENQHMAWLGQFKPIKVSKSKKEIERMFSRKYHYDLA
jgi:hypothetical protein